MKTQEAESLESIRLLENLMFREAADDNDALLSHAEAIGRVLCEIARQLAYLNTTLKERR